MNPKREKGAGAPGIFNVKALYAQDVQEVFVTEGAFDALSVLEAGYTAIALNSAGNFDALIKQLEQRRTAAALILCPDNDSDPRTAERVKKEFGDTKDIWCYTGYVYEDIINDNFVRNTPYTTKLLSLIDILVDGPFIEEEKDLTLRFRGSRNQRILNLKELFRN